MKYTRLGKSDLNVSRICMGCMGFGDASNGQHSWTIDEEHSREIIRRGLELGVNFFDTAIGYQSGTSEQYLPCVTRNAPLPPWTTSSPRTTRRNRSRTLRLTP